MPAAERVLDISETAAHLSVRHEQLVIRPDGLPEASLPLKELAVLVLSHHAVTCSLAALEGIMRHGGSVIICDGAHLPSGLMLPLAANGEQTRRMLAQVGADRPTAKRLWKQIIQNKIRAQAATLVEHHGDDLGLPVLAGQVRSGDPDNIEGRASQRYWPILFGDPMFRRRRDALDQNRLLNYGYAVLRAAVGRAICASGLHPSLGIHHRGRNNPWCLADDLMEPYRPQIDSEVCRIVGEYGTDVPLDRNTKPRLIAVLHARATHQGEYRTLLDWIGRTAASLAAVYLSQSRELFFPKGITEAHGDV